MPRLCLAGLLGTLIALSPSPALADSFVPPSVTRTASASGAWVATVVPAALSCLDGPPSCQPAARATIARADGAAADEAGRGFALLNPQAPGRVLLSDDGERLLTIDDHASFGLGPNVLVVYAADGRVIARHDLAAFLPPDYIDGLPRTVSTLRWWAGEPRIEPGTHVATVPINLVGPDGGFDTRRALPLLLDLDTGVIEQPGGSAFAAALWCARANAWNVHSPQDERRRAQARSRCR